MISSNLSPLKVLERKHITKAELKRIAGGSRIAIVTDNAPIEAKERLISSFSDSEAVVFDKVQPNPRTDDIMQMYKNPAFASCDVIVGIGAQPSTKNHIIEFCRLIPVLGIKSGVLLIINRIIRLITLFPL